MDNKISIIVPVYNVERYLNRCVESILNQTYRSIELILVDDKSKDKSGKICDEISKTDDRVKVIHKQMNEGLGFARNTGMEHATGDYLMFVDSDDYIALDLCEKAVGLLEKSKADVCYFEQKKDINGKLVESDLSFLKDSYEGSAIINDFLLNAISQSPCDSGAPKIGMSACKLLYRREILEKNDIHFCSERDFLNEDLFFRIKLVQFINKVVVLPEKLYYYCYNGNSLTTSYRKDRFEASKRMYCKLLEDTKGFDFDEMRIRCQGALFNNLMVCIRQEITFVPNGKAAMKHTIKSFCEDSVVSEAINKYPIDMMPLKKKVFFNAIKNKQVWLIVLLIKIKELVK